MKTKIILLVSICLLVSKTINAQEDISEAYKNTVIEMFNVTGTEKLYTTMINGMFDMFKRQNTEVSDENWTKLQKEFLKSSIRDLNDLLVPVYHKHLNIEDIKSVIAFYKSESGQKFVEKTPLIMQEAMIIGEEWGKGIGEKIIKEIEEKGY